MSTPGPLKLFDTVGNGLLPQVGVFTVSHES